MENTKAPKKITLVKNTITELPKTSAESAQDWGCG
jgi:hypothetical protein